MILWRGGDTVGSREKGRIRIVHGPTGTPIAEGPIGWEITPFEGNLYIRGRRLLTDRFRPSWIPGLCPYKGLYVWMDFLTPDAERERGLGWMYWLPNPLLPFIAFRIAVPRGHSAIVVKEVEATEDVHRDEREGHPATANRDPGPPEGP